MNALDPFSKTALGYGFLLTVKIQQEIFFSTSSVSSVSLFSLRGRRRKKKTEETQDFVTLILQKEARKKRSTGEWRFSGEKNKDETRCGFRAQQDGALIGFFCTLLEEIFDDVLVAWMNIRD